jgi:hypothetical protein
VFSFCHATYVFIMPEAAYANFCVAIFHNSIADVMQPVHLWHSVICLLGSGIPCCHINSRSPWNACFAVRCFMHHWRSHLISFHISRISLVSVTCWSTCAVKCYWTKDSHGLIIRNGNSVPSLYLAGTSAGWEDAQRWESDYSLVQQFRLSSGHKGTLLEFCIFYTRGVRIGGVVGGHWWNFVLICVFYSSVHFLNCCKHNLKACHFNKHSSVFYV